MVSMNEPKTAVAFSLGKPSLLYPLFKERTTMKCTITRQHVTISKYGHGALKIQQISCEIYVSLYIAAAEESAGFCCSVVSCQILWDTA